jgi:hypothetical protein
LELEPSLFARLIEAAGWQKMPYSTDVRQMTPYTPPLTRRSGRARPACPIDSTERQSVAQRIPHRHPADDAEARYGELLVDRSTFDTVTVERLIDADVLPRRTTVALRERYLIG